MLGMFQSSFPVTQQEIIHDFVSLYVISPSMLPFYITLIAS